MSYGGDTWYMNRIRPVGSSVARHSIQAVRKGAHLPCDPFVFQNIAEQYASYRANSD